LEIKSAENYFIIQIYTCQGQTLSPVKVNIKWRINCAYLQSKLWKQNDCHEIAEILLKVTLNTITLTQRHY